MFRALDADELSELATETLGIATPEAGETPPIAKATIEFPYLAGFIFAVDLRADGGNAALDAAFVEPPTTTEQVLHSEKYLAGEGAQAIEPPRLALLGPGWVALESDVIGELTLRSWLEALEAPRNDAIRAGAGWGGDAYLVARSDRGDLALLARIAWDEPATDAEELVSSLAAALDASPDFEAGDGAWSGPGGWLGLVVEPAGSVAIVVTPSAQTTREVLSALR